MKTKLSAERDTTTFVDMLTSLYADGCPACGAPVGPHDFRDAVSLKEFKISGLCQKCQDAVFGGPE